MTALTPTQTVYQELQAAYDFFNERLFDGQLNPAIITLARNNPRVLGTCEYERFVSADNQTIIHGISLNPAFFSVRPIMATLSTLVHEQCHAWQKDFGEISRNGYHNTEWGDKMRSLGLWPSDTEAPGGKITGQAMSHYIVANGPFHQACNELLATRFTLSWLDRYPAAMERSGLILYPHPDEEAARRKAITDEWDLKAMGLKTKADVTQKLDELDAKSLLADIGRAPDGTVTVTVSYGTHKEDDEDEGDDDLPVLTLSPTPFNKPLTEAVDEDDLAEILGGSRFKVNDIDLVKTLTAAPLPDTIIPAKPKAPRKTGSNRVKYRCHLCHVQVWGRPNLSVLCGNRVHKDEPFLMLAEDVAPETSPTEGEDDD